MLFIFIFLLFNANIKNIKDCILSTNSSIFWKIFFLWNVSNIIFIHYLLHFKIRSHCKIHCNYLLWIKVSCIGVIGNSFNVIILNLNRKRLEFTETFTTLLIVLSAFDLLYLITSIGIFGIPALSPWYNENIFPKILPSW